MIEGMVPLVYLEVVPIILTTDSTSCNDDNIDHAFPSLTNFGVKEYLFRLSKQCSTKYSFSNLILQNDSHASKEQEQYHSVDDIDERQQEQDYGILIYWRKRKGRRSQNGEASNHNNNHTLCGGYLVQRSQNKNNIDDDDSETNQSTGIEMENVEEATLPLFYVPSDDPTVLDPIPCCITGYAFQDYCLWGMKQQQPSCHFSHVAVYESTLVRILPPRLAMNNALEMSQYQPLPMSYRRSNFLHNLLGEVGDDTLSESMQQELIKNHNPETVDELSMKMSMVLSQYIQIGTTTDAFQNQQKQTRQMINMAKSVRAFCERENCKTKSRSSSLNADNIPRTTNHQLNWWPSLIVHSPNHSDGKTLLVQALAKKLGCSHIHIIRFGFLLAKYGTQADAALESQLHGILLSAACREESVCVILDHLDTMLPPRLSGRSSAGDAALPVFNGVASYLRNITASMQRLHEFPFPLKNRLYNSPCSGSYGPRESHILSVKCCIVGILTCPDDGWKFSMKSDTANMGDFTIFDSMISDRFRLPLLSAQTRLLAMEAAIEKQGISLDPSTKTQLPVIAASSVWVKGAAFRKIATQLKHLLVVEKIKEASMQHFEKALGLVKKDTAEFTKVSFEVQSQTPPSGNKHPSDDHSHFASVGGNAAAKSSLQDALALDPMKRELLVRFGLNAPTGILLYGPPGTGKTILAKAVAQILRPAWSHGSQNSVSFGGTFVSLAISEIVSAEVGTSEKMVASSFEFARQNSPSVIFLDEFQALFTDRSRGGSGRLTTTLLQCLDDIKRWHGSNYTDSQINENVSSDHRVRVVVIGATNTPWMIDSAFLRPGRFDRIVHVGLPTALERESILLIHIGRMKISGKEKSDTLNDLCRYISSRTEGYSGADLAALCRAAAVRALLEDHECTEVREDHFKEALYHDVSPSSDQALVQRLAGWRP